MVKFTAPSLLAIATFLPFIYADFRIDYDGNTFVMDGKPFRYVSGSVHYFRVPRQYWRDRLRKVRAAGLNAVSTYVEWSQHERAPGRFDFDGDLDVAEFVRIAREEDLYVILRPGPYICAERDMGGFPYWLLHYHPDMYLRSSDPNYLNYVEKWLTVLMTRLRPLLYGKGGPIILVQVENEYGSYPACDRDYGTWLRDLFQRLVGTDAVLFTTDGGATSFLKCGKIPGVYATVDFGPGTNVTSAFEAQRQYEPQGPLVNSEFYPGWLTHWGEKMASTNTASVTNTLKQMLDVGANVNFYVFHGGTNFGFTAGANFGDTYLSDVTSYDYDAPITEAGDLTEKYFAIRDVIGRYFPLPNITVESSEKGDYGAITLQESASLFSPRIRQSLGRFNQGLEPVTFEALLQNYGYLLYETEIPKDGRLLRINKFGDLATVFLNEDHKGTLSRELKTDGLNLTDASRGDKLSIAVENLGRINYGSLNNDSKGILSDVEFENQILKNWNMTGFELDDLKTVEECFVEKLIRGEISPDCSNGKGFAFYVAKFSLENRDSVILDTYLDVSSLKKGLAFLNGHNLGRYWSTRGPQFTLYVPGVYFKAHPESNLIIIMDEIVNSDTIDVKFSNEPKFTYNVKKSRKPETKKKNEKMASMN